MNKSYDEELEAKYRQAMKDAIIALSYLTGMWIVFVLVTVLLILGIN